MVLQLTSWTTEKITSIFQPKSWPLLGKVCLVLNTYLTQKKLIFDLKINSITSQTFNGCIKVFSAEMVKLKSSLHSLERIFLACSLGVVGGYANIKPLMKQKLLISSYPTVGTSRSKIVWARWDSIWCKVDLLGFRKTCNWQALLYISSFS